jgi:UDP-glucuronate 4-epimerase
VINTIEKKNPNKSLYNLYNIGNGSPIKLNDYIKEIEVATGKEAKRIMMPMQPGDVERTWADTSALLKDYNYKPTTKIDKGIYEFVVWYKKHNKI